MRDQNTEEKKNLFFFRCSTNGRRAFSISLFQVGQKIIIGHGHIILIIVSIYISGQSRFFGEIDTVGKHGGTVPKMYKIS